MLILLPPSETKARPAAGDPVDLEALSWPELTPARRRALSALTRVSGQRNALEVLGVGASLEQEVRANRELLEAPAAPALEVYTGVLYDALGAAELTGPVREQAEQSLVVISALWGALRPQDRIPAYRLSMGMSLTGLGARGSTRLSAFWKPHLRRALGARAEQELVVDCRSAAYAAAFPAPPERTAAVGAVRVRDGERSVVSHSAKHTRGELARHLLEQRAAGARLESAEDLAEVAGRRWEVELTPATGRRAAQLTVVLRG